MAKNPPHIAEGLSDDDTFEFTFPPFSSLPLVPNGPRGNAWGRFGTKDVLGMLNLLTPATVAKAALEIKTGERVSLDWPLNKPSHPSYGRPGFQHRILPNTELKAVNDDFLSFNTQGGSQWDGFRHFGYQNEERYFNDRVQDDVANSNVLGIDSWAESGGIIGRGVLLDYASWASKNSIPIEPFKPSPIPISHLLQLINEQNITFQPGDILFLRTGFTKAFDNLTTSSQQALPNRPTPDFIGIERSEATLKFLWDHQFAAVAGDCPSFESSPVIGPGIDPTWSLHEWLLAGWGMPIGEMFDLEKLSEMCKRKGRWSFFVTSVPLKVPGGVASPPNAVAIF
ncbi:hypothetical protein HYFRA_00002342 [Hymenoscyphus fraxineus]|uniref:Cyclase n=1 Tax=Hymenoscyphus fraxineus TaxID=746836 RepID=A0A9N9L5N5_9HELO|nr:hypothetical protein HYFRA_00002342 [Hymenoscyphus fraxineus]